MDGLMSFLLIIALAFVISLYSFAIILVCIMFGVFNKKQDYDFQVVKAIWSFVIVTFIFYGIGKVGYWILML